MFYYIDIESFTGVQRHILECLEDGGMRSFPLIDDNPNTPKYLKWLEEGNTPEEWNPDILNNGGE